VRARQRDVQRRRQRVHQAITDMLTNAEEIGISSVAARARVHRSFIHRHTDLHSAVLAAADPPATGPDGGAGGTAVSRRSLLADNANQREHAQRLQQRVTDLEARLSDLLGAHAAECAGFGPLDTASTRAELDDLRQQIIDLQHTLEERDEELAATREAHRRLMTEINRPSR
jgi:hypothetical protein